MIRNLTVNCIKNLLINYITLLHTVIWKKYPVLDNCCSHGQHHTCVCLISLIMNKIPCFQSCALYMEKKHERKFYSTADCFFLNQSDCRADFIMALSCRLNVWCKLNEITQITRENNRDREQLHSVSSSTLDLSLIMLQ